MVRAFYSSNLNELKNVIEKHTTLFSDDSNSGLVAQVVIARQKTSIKRLTKTFLTLSLEDVASRVGLESPQAAEKQLVAMIEEGSIFARISQQDGKNQYLDLRKDCLEFTLRSLYSFYQIGMVRFDTNPESYNSVKMLRNLESKVENLISLDNHISSMEEEIMVNPKYIKSMGNAGSSLHGRAVAVGKSQCESLTIFHILRQINLYFSPFQN